MKQKIDFKSIRPILEQLCLGSEKATNFNVLYRAACEAGRISKGDFTSLITNAVEDGQLLRKEGRGYYLPLPQPADAAPATDAELIDWLARNPEFSVGRLAENRKVWTKWVVRDASGGVIYEGDSLREVLTAARRMWPAAEPEIEA